MRHVVDKVVFHLGYNEESGRIQAYIRRNQRRDEAIELLGRESATGVFNSCVMLLIKSFFISDITKSPDVFKHISGVINDETKRLSFLVEKVLQMSLFERQKAALKLKEIDANDLVANVANTFVLKVEKYGGTMDIDLQATESDIYVDEMHITNVLFNLMDNALNTAARKFRLH